MKTLRLLFAFLIFPALAAAQQSVPVTIPTSMMPVPLTIKGLPAGCSWTATGGAQIIVTVSGCPTAPVPGVTSVTVSGPSSIASTATAAFTATVVVTNGAAQTVTWAATNGTITQAGVFTPATGATSAIITAKSTVDPTKVGTATLSITQPSSGYAFPPGTNVITLGTTSLRATPSGSGKVLAPITAGQAFTVIGTPTPSGNGFNWLLVQETLGSVTTGATTTCTPTSVSATCGYLGDDNIQTVGAAPATVLLQWTPSVSSNLTGYNAYRGTKSGGPYTKIGSTGATVPTFKDAAPLSGTSFYVVTATGDPNSYQTPESVFSNECQVAIP